MADFLTDLATLLSGRKISSGQPEDLFFPTASDIGGYETNAVPTDAQGDVASFGTPGGAPDQQKDLMTAQGYVDPARATPFQQNDAAIRSIISDRPSPFNIFDLNPKLDNGVESAGSSGANFPRNNTTPLSVLAQISKLTLGNNLLVQLSQNQIFPLYGIGVTYEIPVHGNFLKVDRLAPEISFTPGFIFSPQAASRSTDPGIVNDAAAQTMANLILNGAYIQLENIDAPVIQIRSGEIFNVPFTRIYVTLFGSSGRWRVTTGNNASITQKTDERLLRQNLAIWDGAGVLDSPMYAPVPFCTYPLYNTVTSSTSFYQILSNYDPGTTINVTNGAGVVKNKGYKIAFITGIYINVQSNGNLALALVQIRKGMGTLLSNGFSGPTTKTYFQTQVAIASQGNTVIAQNAFIPFNTPIRVVLGGYDVNIGGQPQNGSGESLSYSVTDINGAGINYNVTVIGYTLGDMNTVLPVNPYPQDVMSLF